MASRGDSTTTTAFGFSDVSKSTLTIPATTELAECCYILPLFGHTTDTDELKNDKTSYFNFYDPKAVTAVSLVFQKCESGAFVDKHTVTDNTYGTYSSLGAEVIGGLNYISIKNIDWTQILDDFGEGVYRIQTRETNVLASLGVQNSESLTYELKNFTAERANDTVFFKVENSGYLGDRNDPTKRFSFPADWEDGIRIHGTFGQDSREYEKEYTVYNDGFKEYIREKGIDKMTFVSDRISEEARNYFKNELMMANRILVTNYGTNLANTHVKTPVHGSGEFSPVYTYRSKLAGFEVEFSSAYDNQEKKHC